MRDYTLTVPFMNSCSDENNREKILVELKRCGADRVFIAGAGYSINKETQQKQFEELKVNYDFYKKNGFEVGVWFDSTYVFDADDSISIEKRVTKEGLTGNNFCHADENLLNLASEYATEFARIGFDLIMYDDNFHFGLQGTCYCDNHKRLFYEMYGDKYDFEEVRAKALDDLESEETKLMLAIGGESFRRFAKKVRDAVDIVNPDVRMGICANIGNYNIAGITLEEVTRILAGKNKPFVRTIGSPYWDYYPGWPNRLSYAIELEREQIEKLNGKGIETMCEGDVFPRPRIYTNAAPLECFDMVMIADGKFDGILKYMIDYYAPADYETGYVDFHVDNKDIREDIGNNFENKIATGVRMYGLPEGLSISGSFFSQLSIPTTYEGEGIVGAAFGDAAKYVDKKVLDKGLIIDVKAAKILTDRGIDVGLRSEPIAVPFVAEDYGKGVYFKSFASNKGYYKIDVDEKAVIDSFYMEHERRYSTEAEEIERVPAAYRYENADGQRFFVMAIDVETALKQVLKESFRSYAKAEQVMNGAEWAGRKTLPVKCYKYPDLYVMCKEDETSVAVGLWNFSKDKIKKPEIKLDKKYADIGYLNCTGEMFSDKVELSTLYPYEFSGFVLKK